MGLARDLFHYSAYHLKDIAETARDVDLAIRWGYGWSLGPFETWQAAGWKRVAEWIAEDIVAGKAMKFRRAAGLGVRRPRGRHGAGQLQPGARRQLPRSSLPVYKRQRFPDRCWASASPRRDRVRTRACAPGTTATASPVIRSRPKHTVSDKGAVRRAGGHRHRRARLPRRAVIWQPKEPFLRRCRPVRCAGACCGWATSKGFDAMVANFQATSQRIKYSLVPVVGAVCGLALGGGCEFQMHNARTVAHLEATSGLVEAGVGLLPAGGGLKELAVRAPTPQARGGDVFRTEEVFETIAMGQVSTSAVRPRNSAWCGRTTWSRSRLRAAAHRQAGSAGAGRRLSPPLPARRRAGGWRGRHRHLQMLLVNMLEGRFISPHDCEIATRIATVLCGGEIDRGSLVDEDWLLRLEREHFVALAQMPKTAGSASRTCSRPASPCVIERRRHRDS